MKISIVIPIYNVQEYLERCMQSVVNQTYSNLEILAIDDGSTDNSSLIYNKFASYDSRIHIKKQKNMGLSGARNTGIKEATGDYMFFLDADDWLDDDYIERCVKEIVKTNTDWLITPYIREYKDNPIRNDLMVKKKYSFDEYEVKSFLTRRLIGLYGSELKNPASIDDFSPVWGKFYKTQYCKDIKFEDTKLIGTEDLLFNFNYVLKICSAFYFGGAYYHYNKQNSNSLVTKYNENLYVGWLRLYKIIENTIKMNNFGATFSSALNNRIILNLMGLMRNIMGSDLSYSSKRRKSLEILSNPLYGRVFKKFNFQKLPLPWKLFFKMCEYESIFSIYCLLRIAEPIKEKLK